VKKAVALAVLLSTLGAAVVIAQRIITNPKPDAHLKVLFPSAAAFSPLSGDPLHFTAYGADPKSTPPAPQSATPSGLPMSCRTNTGTTARSTFSLAWT
jgi:hypothetical protein